MSEKQLAIPESNQIVIADNRGARLESLDDMRGFARDIANSGLAPSSFKTPEAILVAMQHGMELGLSPMQAIHSIAVINGRPTIYGDAALALVRSHPMCEDVVETFERGKTEEEIRAVCEVKRRGCAPVVRTFSVDDAKKAGLWKKSGPWSQYPKRMLQMRARSFAIRDAFPDALKGIGVSEEVQDIPKPASARVVATTALRIGDETLEPETPTHEPEPEEPPLDPVDDNGDFKF